MTKKSYDDMFNQWDTEAKCPSEEDIPKEIQNHVKAVEDEYDNASRDDAEERRQYHQLRKKYKEGKPPGELVTEPAAYLRARFVEAVFRVSPEVFSSLAKDVFPAYREAYSEIRPRRFEHIGGSDADILFVDKLKQWSKQWRLTPDWMLNHAMDVMAEWCRHPETKGKKPAVITVFDGVYIDDDEGSFSVDQYLPWQETKTEFLDRVQRAAQEHVCHREKDYKQHGWCYPAKKRLRDHGDDYEKKVTPPKNLHFDILAIYLTKGFKTNKEVANYYLAKHEFTITEVTTEKIVRRLSDVLKLPLK